MNVPEPDLAARVSAVAADVFGVPLDALRPESGPDSVDSWDSITHLNFMLALEQAFGTAIPADRMPDLTSIEKVTAEIRRLKAL